LKKSGALYIGTYGGIPLFIHSSWILVFFLFVYDLATEVFPSLAPRAGSATWILESIAATLLIYVTVVAHELAHSLVSQAYGHNVREITLYVFGGAAMLDREPDAPLHEALMAIAGPLTSFAFAAFFYLLSNAAIFYGADITSNVLSVVSLVNLYLGIFNLTPGFPLDGGRILRALIWARSKDRLRATRLAVYVTRALVAGAAMYAFLLLTWGDFSGLWLGFIALIVLVSANNSLRYTVLEAAWNEPISTYAVRVPALTVRELREGLIPESPPAVVVDGAVVGILTGANGGVRLVSDFIVCPPDTPAIRCFEELQERAREFAVIAPGVPAASGAPGAPGAFGAGWAYIVGRSRLVAAVQKAAGLKLASRSG
jgi:Zn-dependent protease